MPRTSSDMLSIVSLTQYATNDSTQGVLVREPGRTRIIPLLLGLLLAYTCVLLVCSLDALSEFAQGSALDLSQNGIGHFGIPRQHIRLNHVSTLLVGCRGDRGGEWTLFKHQHSPSVPQITMLSDMRVVALSQKDNNFTTYINSSVAIHQSPQAIAFCPSTQESPGGHTCAAGEGDKGP